MLFNALMASGALLLVIGIIADWNSHHLGQRLLANGLVNGFFFFALGLGALFFLALQYATETGWYASVKRIIEAQAGFLPWGMALLGLVLLIITFADGAHIYLWMDPAKYTEGSADYDAIIDGKRPYLNEIFFWIRTIIYFVVYYLYYRGFKNRSLEEDKVGGTAIHILNYKKSAVFLVFFSVFSSTSAWDWLMSIDVHWFSTLYGWYTFAGMWCSAMVVLVITVLYLRNWVICLRLTIVIFTILGNGYLQLLSCGHICSSLNSC